MSQQLKDGVQLRRADNNERFVAFAFAAADMVVEVDLEGRITYAAGAFRSRLGAAPESFVGRPVAELVAPADRDALDGALLLLGERGRLLPWMVRLSNAARTPVALAGLRLAQPDRPARLCLTFALPPVPAGLIVQATTAHRLLKAAEALLGAGPVSIMSLLDVSTAAGPAESDLVGPALEAIAPDAIASEVAPGRFGLLHPPGPGADPVRLAARLEATLRAQGVPTDVTSRQIRLESPGLSPVQAARALRQALSVFARDGGAGLDEAGFGDGLAAYVQAAMGQCGAVRRVIAEREFVILYQPIVDLATRALHHYEALIRPGPGSPARSPQEFVTLVETVGLADELDLTVAQMACEAAEQSTVPIAFNLSGQSIQSQAFRERLLPLLERSRAVQDRRVLVEMTETAQIDDLKQAAITVRALQALHIPFCLDDFGAGTADVRLLRAIPADVVKLDGSFVAGVLTEGRDRAFVAGMVEIARATGAAVVAERVETEEEAAALQAIGATYGQGWLFGRPAPLPVRPVIRPVRRRGEQAPQWG